MAKVVTESGNSKIKLADLKNQKAGLFVDFMQSLLLQDIN